MFHILLAEAKPVTGSESLWAEHGLTGLVLCALFGLILVFIRQLQKKDSFLKTILDDARQDRDKEREERNKVALQNKESSDKLAAAINKLTDELRD